MLNSEEEDSAESSTDEGESEDSKTQTDDDP